MSRRDGNTGANRRSYIEKDSDDDAIAELEFDDNNEADNGLAYDAATGLQLNTFKNAERDWLSRTYPDSDKKLRFYAPQVGDDVVYVAHVHQKHLTSHIDNINVNEVGKRPWQQFPSDESWPVITCKVVKMKYFFPFEESEQRSVISQVELQVTGIRADPSQSR